jgi:predicted amidohydrolase YtcJ
MYIDSHLHVLAAARTRRWLDVSRAAGLDELLRLLAQAPGTGWLRAWGYDDFELGRHPTAADLRAACGERPVRLVHRSGHRTITTGPGEPPRPPRSQLLDDAGEYLRAAKARGVTTFVDASGHADPDSLALLEEAAARAGVRVDALVAPQRVARTGFGVKVRTPPRDWRELVPLARACAERELILAVHAVEAEEFESAIALAQATHARVRVEHAGLMLAGQPERLAEAGVDVVVQPALAVLRADAYLARFPPALQPYLHPLKRLVDAGVRVAFSSDAPVTPCDPALWLTAAQERRVAPAEALTAAQAQALACDTGGVSAARRAGSTSVAKSFSDSANAVAS